VGQGLVGAVAAPVSGGLDLFSSAIEGLDASKERLLGRPRAGTLLARRRLPRVIGGEAKLQPFIRDGSETAVSRAPARHLTAFYPHSTQMPLMTHPSASATYLVHSLTLLGRVAMEGAS
jgi:hypothetical protein